MPPGDNLDTLRIESKGETDAPGTAAVRIIPAGEHRTRLSLRGYGTRWKAESEGTVAFLNCQETCHKHQTT